jgi:hypothetical protein
VLRWRMLRLMRRTLLFEHGSARFLLFVGRVDREIMGMALGGL